MTDTEVFDLLATYERVITEHIHVPTHLLTMIPKMRDMITELASDPAIVPEGANQRREKLHRWLGFMQGVLWACGIYTIDQLRAHNRGPQAVPVHTPPSWGSYNEP